MKKIINLLLVLLLSGSFKNASAMATGELHKTQRLRMQKEETMRHGVERARQAEQTRARLAEEKRLAEVELAEVERARQAEQTRARLAEAEPAELELKAEQPGIARRFWNQMTRNSVVAGITGALFGAFTTGVVMTLNTKKQEELESTDEQQEFETETEIQPETEQAILDTEETNNPGWIRSNKVKATLIFLAATWAAIEAGSIGFDYLPEDVQALLTQYSPELLQKTLRAITISPATLVFLWDKSCDKIADGARLAGDKMTNGARLAGDKIVNGAKFAGDKIAYGARFAGDKIVDGARFAGDKVTNGVRLAGDKIAKWLSVLTTRDTADVVTVEELAELEKVFPTGMPEPKPYSILRQIAARIGFDV